MQLHILDEVTFSAAEPSWCVCACACEHLHFQKRCCLKLFVHQAIHHFAET